jgi:deferrochelatase/peroxidase EfeB
VQACADDPTVAFHVIRNFARLARGTAVIRWSQLGFGRTSSTSTAQRTERNLIGFKDGTRNIKSEDAADFDDYVWAGGESEQPWMRGGSHLVARRIRMLIESWDTDALSDQQNVFGRFKTSGAPLTGKGEFDTPDLAAKAKDGTPVIPLNAHIRLASPATNSGQKILRRGYSYTDGIDADTGLLDAGLFFLAYQMIRARSSCRSSAGSARGTTSTSTSGSPAAPCSPCRRGSRRPATGGARRFSPRNYTAQRLSGRGGRSVKPTRR